MIISKQTPIMKIAKIQYRRERIKAWLLLLNKMFVHHVRRLRVEAEEIQEAPCLHAYNGDIMRMS